MVLFEVAKGIVTGSTPKVSDLRTLDEGELKRAGTLDEPRPNNV
jgi:hypothetical protein